MKFKIPLFEFGLEFRPIRLSAIILAGFMVMILWLAFHYDISGLVVGAAGAEGTSAGSYTRGFIDASLIMVALTTIGNAVLRLSDDGGDSDAVKIMTRHFDYLEGKKAQAMIAEDIEAQKNQADE